MDREHELLEHFVAHPAWEGIMKPMVAQQVTLYYAQLLDPSQTRKDSVSDDYLRGAIRACKWMIEWPTQEIDAARRRSEEEAALDRESEEEVPLFGGGRPATEGEAHGRAEEVGG